jgi:hypothetical protein
MLATPLPELNWSAWLYCDVGPATHDANPFAEEGDIAAEVEITTGGVNFTIVRYHYPERAGRLHV